MLRQLSIFDFIRRRQIKSAFRNHVTPEAVDSILRGERLAVPALKPAMIEFVLLLFDPAYVPTVITTAVDMASKHHGYVEVISGPLMLVTFIGSGDSMPMAEAATTSRQALSAALISGLSGEFRMLHGRQPGHVGFCGDDSRLVFGTIFQDHALLLKALLGLEPGQIQLWQPAPLREV